MDVVGIVESKRRQEALNKPQQRQTQETRNQLHSGFLKRTSDNSKQRIQPKRADNAANLFIHHSKSKIFERDLLENSDIYNENHNTITGQANKHSHREK